MKNINKRNNQYKVIIKLVIKIIKISLRQSNIVIGLFYVIPPCVGTGKNYCYWIIYLESVHIFKVSTSYFIFCHHLHNRSRNCHLYNCYRNCHLQSSSQQMYIMQVVLSFHFSQNSIFIKREEFIMSKRKSLDKKPSGRN